MAPDMRGDELDGEGRVYQTSARRPLRAIRAVRLWTHSPRRPCSTSLDDSTQPEAAKWAAEKNAVAKLNDKTHRLYARLVGQFDECESLLEMERATQDALNPDSFTIDGLPQYDCIWTRHPSTIELGGHIKCPSHILFILEWVSRSVMQIAL